MKPIAITGWGLWSPGFANADAWFEGVADRDVVKPKCELVGPRLKRGSSRFANMLGEVVAQAAAAAEVDVTTVPTFYGSSLGEVGTMVTLLRMLFEEEGKLSPNRFKNSVHNAASGLVSIGTQNTSFSTAIAGGSRSFETTLIEAWAYLADLGGDAIVAVADDEVPEPLDALDDQDALAVGFALRAGDGPVRLENLRVVESAERYATMTPRMRANCASPGLELLDALRNERGGPVALTPTPGAPQWVADLVFGA